MCHRYRAVMRFSLWTSSGRTWPEILAGAELAADLGWYGVWVPDHFMPPEGGYGGGAGPDAELGPVHEAWTLAAAIGAAVSRVRVGVLVSGNTYRHPAVVAKMATTLDHITHGRAVLGLGASWQENEHRRYGIPFGSPAERSGRLEEAAEIIRHLLTEPRTSFNGRHYHLDEAPLEPKPIHPLPLLIGGGGERRTLRTAARWAQEWNIWGRPADLAAKGAVLDAHCRAAGRDPGDITRSACAYLEVLDDPAKAEERRQVLGRQGGLVGTPDEIRAAIAAYGAAGVSEIVVADYNHTPATRDGAMRRLAAILASG